MVGRRTFVPRFRVKTLFLLVALAAWLLAAFVKPARDQKRASDIVKSLSGYVIYADERFDETWRAPLWIRRALGDDYFRTVIGIGLNHDPSSLAEKARFGKTSPETVDLSKLSLAFVRGLPKLRTLTLYSTSLPGDDLAHLEGCTYLEQLTLSYSRTPTPGTSPNLECLPEFPNLENLVLENVELPKSGLSFLRRLPKLKTLVLVNVKLTSDDLETLCETQTLRSLALNDLTLFDDDLSGIGKLLHLEVLSLDGTNITGEGLKQLTKLQGLQELSVRNTDVNDQGLLSLTVLPQLTHVFVSNFGEKITFDGVAAFQRVRPKCSVSL